MASMSSDCRFRPVECSYLQLVSVFVPQDKFGDQQYTAVERVAGRNSPIACVEFQKKSASPKECDC